MLTNDVKQKILLGICKACDCYCAGQGCLENSKYCECQYCNDIADSIYSELSEA